MNLKEEINQFFKDNDEYNISKDDGYTVNRFEIALTKDELIDGILKIFEKRIDEMIENVISTDGLDVPHAFHAYGYRNALLNVKEMLLKE